MPGKPFVLMWAAADTEETLKARYLAEVHAQRRQWLHGLWLLRRGWRVDAVADAVGAGRRTVERWIDWYRSGGLDGVLAHRQGGDGRPPRLSVAQQEQVGDAVASGRFRTAAEIGAWIAASFGVVYRPGGVASLLARLRCHPKVPRPMHEQADPAAQDAWKGGALRTRSRRSASPSGSSLAGRTRFRWGCSARCAGAGAAVGCACVSGSSGGASIGRCLWPWTCARAASGIAGWTA